MRPLTIVRVNQLRSGNLPVRAAVEEDEKIKGEVLELKTPGTKTCNISKNSLPMGKISDNVLQPQTIKKC